MKPEDVIVKITIFKTSQNLLGLKMATYFTAQSNFSKTDAKVVEGNFRNGGLPELPTLPRCFAKKQKRKYMHLNVLI